MTELLRAEGIEKTYRMGRKEIRVLRGIDLTIMQGEIVSLVGTSGAGKSTILHILGLLDTPSKGTIYYRGKSASTLTAQKQARLRHDEVGFVFQFYHLIPELNALQNVCLAEMMLRSFVSYMGARREIRARAEEILAQIGLQDRMKHRPSQLSGGERQRVAIARALISSPSVILADEPTGNLDSETAEGILELIWEINEKQGIAFLFVTHNEQVAGRTDRIMRLEDGKILDQLEFSSGHGHSDGLLEA